MSSSRSSLAALLSSLAVLCCAGVGGYWYFDHHHLTDDLRHTLAMAVDSGSTESDILMDLRNAKSQIHTTYDAELAEELQQAVQLMQNSSAAVSQQAGELDEEATQSATLKRDLALEQQYLKRRRPVPQSLKEAIQQETQAQQQTQTHSADASLDRKASEEDAAAAQQIFQQIRSSLGLPPQAAHEPSNTTE